MESHLSRTCVKIMKRDQKINFPNMMMHRGPCPSHNLRISDWDLRCDLWHETAKFIPRGSHIIPVLTQFFVFSLSCELVTHEAWHVWHRVTMLASHWPGYQHPCLSLVEWAAVSVPNSDISDTLAQECQEPWLPTSPPMPPSGPQNITILIHFQTLSHSQCSQSTQL